MSIKEGDLIRVLSVPPKYKEFRYKVFNCEGVIVDTHYASKGSIGIKIDGVENDKSEKGIFWLSKNEITKIKEKENKTMNINDYLKKNYNFYITVKPGNKDKTEVQIYTGELNIGDYVICNNNYSDGALSVRIVKEALDKDELINISITGEIMGVADVSKYFERKDKEKKAAELKKKMIERAKKYQEESFWRMIANEDAEMAELLKDYDLLTK